MLVILLAVAASPVVAAGLLPVCTKAESQAPKVFNAEADAHRKFERVVANYPAGADPEDLETHLEVAIRVDETGRPTCFVDPDGDFRPSRAAQVWMSKVPDWRYDPFVRDGKAVPVVAYQEIDVQILPGRTVEVPPVSADTTSLTLVRAGCFWQCPEYSVTVRGDGWVGYQGTRYVDVTGRRAWRIPAAEVAPLLQLARSPELWGATGRHVADTHDAETVMLRVDVGGRRQQILSYPADHPGAPIAARRLHAAIDEVSGVRLWTRLSDATLDALQREGFDFRSPAAGGILARAMGHERGHDEAAILRLIELGAPLVAPPSGPPGAPPGVVFPHRDSHGGDLLDIALRLRLSSLVGPLIGRGALMTEGRPDQEKMDSAFRAAIMGGRLAAVEEIWNVAGGRPRPALDYAEHAMGNDPSPRRYPVALLLDGGWRDEGKEAIQIAGWLEARGNNLAAKDERGHTLLNTAVRQEDAAFMLFLLERGLDPAVVDQDNLLNYGIRHGESMALALLEAQARHHDSWELPARYRDTATDQGWTRVLAWLDAHPGVTLRDPRKRRCHEAEMAARAAAEQAEAAGPGQASRPASSARACSG